MKARVKATGEIVEIIAIDGDWLFCSDGAHYGVESLEGIDHEIDYWTHLEHQAAIAAMGGMCGNTSYDETAWEDMAEDAIRAAHALVEKMKEERR